MTAQPLNTPDELLAALAAAKAAGDGTTATRLVAIGTQWALDADLDHEFAHDGIYWDAASPEEVGEADAVAKRAKEDLARLLTDPAIEAEYQAELQGQHYQAMRAERTRQPSLSDEDEYA